MSRSEPNSAPHDPYAALRLPNYRNYAGGLWLSMFGVLMQQTAVAWEVYERTSSAMALGFIGLAQALPVIVLALPGGHTADIHDRKKILRITQLVYACCSAGLLTVSAMQLPVWMTFVFLAAAGCAKAFNSPARGALLPEIVPGETFHNAVTWNSGAFHFAATVGPICAGLLIARTGVAWPVYLASGIGSLAFVMLLGRVVVRPMPARDPEKDGYSLRSMIAGLSFVMKEKTILAAITLDLFAVLLGGATTLMPQYAKQILHVDAIGLGMLRAAPYVGALLMAIWLAHRPPFQKAGRALLLSVAGFGVATIAFGLSTSFLFSLAMLMTLGAVDNISVVIRHVLVQSRTPNEVRGRVAAVNSVFIESSNELGGFESGLVSRLFGPVVSVVSGGIGTLLVVAGIAWAWPEIRKLGPLQPRGTQAEALEERLLDADATR